MKQIDLIFVISIFIFLSHGHLLSQNNYSNSSTHDATNLLEETKDNSIINIKLSEFKMFRLEEFVGCCGTNTKCRIVGFHLHKDRRIQTYNGGPGFSSASRYLISQSEAGDNFILENIRYKCPLSDSIVLLDDLVFKIERE